MFFFFFFVHWKSYLQFIVTAEEMFFFKTTYFLSGTKWLTSGGTWIHNHLVTFKVLLIYIVAETNGRHLGGGVKLSNAFSNENIWQLKISGIGSDNCLAPTRRQAIIWSNDGLKSADAYMHRSASMR